MDVHSNNEKTYLPLDNESGLDRFILLNADGILPSFAAIPMYALAGKVAGFALEESFKYGVSLFLMPALSGVFAGAASFVVIGGASFIIGWAAEKAFTSLHDHYFTAQDPQDHETTTDAALSALATEADLLD